MPLRTPKVSQTVSYRMANGKTTDAVVLARQEAAPPQPTTTTSTTGGTLADGTYSYRITAVINGFETLPSPAKTQVAGGGGTSTVTVNWTTLAATAPYSNATAFKVYGRISGSQQLMATVTMPTTTFTDNGSVTPAGALPTATDQIRLKLIFYKTLITNAVKATAAKQINRYYAR